MHLVPSTINKFSKGARHGNDRVYKSTSKVPSRRCRIAGH